MIVAYSDNAQLSKRRTEKKICQPTKIQFQFTAARGRVFIIRINLLLLTNAIKLSELQFYFHFGALLHAHRIDAAHIINRLSTTAIRKFLQFDCFVVHESYAGF